MRGSSWGADNVNPEVAYDVRPANNGRSADWMRCSEPLSRFDVASSRMTIRGPLRITHAMGPVGRATWRLLWSALPQCHDLVHSPSIVHSEPPPLAMIQDGCR